MANVIKHKRGSGSDPAANNLVLGELAIRTDNGKLFTKMDSGAIAEIAGGGSDIAINTLSSSSATGGGSATFNGSAYRFTLSSPPSVSAAQLLVSVNGVIQKPVAGTGQPSEGFSVSGNDIIFGDAPATGADFFILTFRSLGVSEPADNSVTSAKIVDGAIVNADINASAAIAGTKISPDFGSQNIVTTGSLGSGDITITGTNPEIFFTDSNNNSDFRIKLESGIFAIQDTTNSNANRLAIDSSGLVGIGTTSPAAPFHVYNATNNTVARLESGDATARLHLKDNSGETFVEATGDNLIFSNTSSTTERMRIDSSGRVGINQTSFATSDTMLSISELTGHLEVGLLSKNDSACVINFGDPEDYNIGRIKYANDDNSMRFDANDAERMRINSSGNVGIGTTSPAGKLHISSGTSDDCRLIIESDTDNDNEADNPSLVFRQDGGIDVSAIGQNFSGTTGTGNNQLFIANSVSNGGILFCTGTSNGFTNATERMRIDSSGKVGINETSPAAAIHITNSAHYVVTDSGKATNGIHVEGPPGNAGEFGGAISFSCGSADSSAAIAARQGGSDADYTGLSFFTHPSGVAANDAVEKVRIHHSGEASFNDGICLGNGLTLSADNTLDDYEEGTWTPDWRGASALGTTSYGSYNVGSYIKIGDQVTVRGYSEITGNSGGSGMWFINNLPFIVKNGHAYRSVGSVLIENFNLNSDIIDVVCYSNPNVNDMHLRGNRDDANYSANISVQNDTDFQVAWTLTYQVA